MSRVRSHVRYCFTQVAMQNLGVQLAQELRPGALITLSGALGAGKSVLARALIHALGYGGHVKSPTYTLVETYELETPSRSVMQVAHYDLFRLAEPEELLYLGFEDCLGDSGILLIEWPEKAGDFLPEPSHAVRIDYLDAGGRRVRLDMSGAGKDPHTTYTPAARHRTAL